MTQKSFKIAFAITGYVVQNVRIIKPDITPARLVEMLNKNIALTTVQDGGTVDCPVYITASGEKIAEVVEVMTTKSDVSYTEFDVY